VGKDSLAVRRSAEPAALADLGVADFAAILGVASSALPRECTKRIRERSFAHRVIAGAERDALVLEAIMALEADLPVSGPARIAAWEHGWGDISERFESSGGDPETLWPHYFRPGVMRLRGEYVHPIDPLFERHFVAVLLAWLAHAHLTDVPLLYEFGCGPGHNLVDLARLLPHTRFVGLDWAAASQRIVGRLGEVLGRDVSARGFDMFEPDRTLAIEPGAAVLSVGSMEQLGDRFGAFLDFLRESDAALCVHVEPLHELYDEHVLLDALAARYAEKRGYLRGFLPRLEDLAAAGEIEIRHVRRHLGSQFHDGWGTIIWRKIAGKRETK
jgi:SAM-dependent methyltransferase